MSHRERRKTRYRRLSHVLVLILLMLILAWIYDGLFLSRHIRSDDAYVAGNVIPVQALVPGVITQVHVDNSMPVRAGQVLVDEEQSLSRQRMNGDAAALADAVRQIYSAVEQSDQDAREISTLRAEQEKLSEDLRRYTEAAEGGAVSQIKVSDTQADITIVHRQMEAAQAKYEKAWAEIAHTTVAEHPQVLQKRAAFMTSYIQFYRARTRAPVDGYIANRRIQAGENVTTGQLLMNIIPLQDLWVTANIRETDMRHLRPGQPVIMVAASHVEEHTYHGQVLGIEPAGGSTFSLFPPDNSTGNYIHIVERIPVRISLNREELQRHPLRPGMSMTVDINSDQEQDQDVLQSKVSAASVSYVTTIYDRELTDASKAADHIIAETLHKLLGHSVSGAK